ncbi:MAG: hypothetical protein U1E27_09830, partial [Kiritimatiellia bacterium]|nr:hypothetical protein [Kiritimatiellia bacterium]
MSKRILTTLIALGLFSALDGKAIGQIDISLGVAGSPNPVVQGSPFTYTVTVTNLGPDDVDEGAAQFLRVDCGPAMAGLEEPQASPQSGTMENTWWYPDLIPVGQSRILVLSGKAMLPGTNSVTFQALLAEDMDPNLNNNTATQVFLVEPRVDMVVYKNPVPGPILVNESFQYGVIVANRGPGMAENVNRDNILDFNTVLKQVAKEQRAYYLNLFDLLCDENGFLPSRYSSSDGL